MAFLCVLWGENSPNGVLPVELSNAAGMAFGALCIRYARRLALLRRWRYTHTHTHIVTHVVTHAHTHTPTHAHKHAHTAHTQNIHTAHTHRYTQTHTHEAVGGWT